MKISRKSLFSSENFRFDSQYQFSESMYFPPHVHVGSYFYGLLTGWYLSSTNRHLTIDKVKSMKEVLNIFQLVIFRIAEIQKDWSDNLRCHPLCDCFLLEIRSPTKFFGFCFISNVWTTFVQRRFFLHSSCFSIAFIWW